VTSSSPASRPNSPASDEEKSSWQRDLFLLAVGFGLLLFFQLGTMPLGNPDEGRYAEIPREMLATGDWVTPRLNGVNYFEKPPLTYWLIAAAQKTFGFNEWTARAIPALFALAGILFTYATARRIYGRNAGLASAVVLGTSLLYFTLGRILTLDMGVSVLMSATLCCFILGVREQPGLPRRLLFYGLYVSAALATLTKGLIGFLLTGAVMFLWLLIFNQWKRLRPLHLPTGILLFLLIAAPWHILAALRNESWAHRYFVYEHWLRFTSPVASRPGPIWYFIPIIVGGLFPWIGFLWSALRAKLRGGWTARARNVDTWFFVTWAGFVFLFFSKSQSKLIPYILPVFPPLAMVIGAWLADVLGDGVAKLRAGLRVFSFACGLLAVGLFAVVLNLGHLNVIKDPAQALALRPYGCVMAVVLLVGGILTPWFATRRGARAALATLATTIFVFYGILTHAAPDLQKPGTKDLALYVKTHAQPGDRVIHYHNFFHDFVFYAERTADTVNYAGELEIEEDAAARASGRFFDEAEFLRQWSGPGRLWVVARKSDCDALFATPSFQYHLIRETRRHYLFSNQP